MKKASPASNAWDINQLADLILGPTPTAPPSLSLCSPTTTPSQVAVAPGRQPLRCRPVVVLVDRRLNPVRAVSAYASALCAEGEAAAVLWLGQAGIRFRCFDSEPKDGWAQACTAALEQKRFGKLTETLWGSVDRLIFAFAIDAPWRDWPLLDRIGSACVILEPTSRGLTQAYSVLKSLAICSPKTCLSCFVVSAESSDQARGTAQRLGLAAERFLDQNVAFEGFATGSELSDLRAETYVAELGVGASDPLQQALAQVMDPDACSPGSESSAVGCPEADPGAQHALPELEVWDTERALESSHDLDVLLAERIRTICPDAEDSWPIYVALETGCCFRWVRRAGGARALVVSTLQSSRGALEQAAAQLHPARADDQIIVLAPWLSADQRKASCALSPSVRLFELAQLPPSHKHSLVLKDVTAAI